MTQASEVSVPADILQALENAQETIQQQKALLDELTSPPWQLGTVSAVYKDTVVLDGTREYPRSKQVDSSWVGRKVRLAMTGQVLDCSQFEQFGGTGEVTHVEPGLLQVQVDMGTVTVGQSKVPVAVGDTVVLDSGSTVILRKVTKVSPQVFHEDTLVSWDDIGGLQADKAALRESFELPYQHPALFKLFGRGPSKGFLLHGRPGNGKTLLGKATATAVAKLHKANGSGGFIYVKGPEVLSKWVGESEENIRLMFYHARQHKAKSGYPAVIFVDEADALLGVRGQHTTSGMEHTIVPQFLSEMDGLQESAAIVLLATNRADTLDPAVVRPGRIDRKLLVAAPSEEDALEHFAIHMRKLPVVGSRADLIKRAAKALYSLDYPLYEIEPESGPNLDFTMGDLVSGALIKAAVDAAVSAAINRNIQQASATKQPSGLEWADVEGGLKQLQLEQYGMNHDVELKEFLDARGMEAESITPLVPGAKRVKREKKPPISSWSWKGGKDHMGYSGSHE